MQRITRANIEPERLAACRNIPGWPGYAVDAEGQVYSCRERRRIGPKRGSKGVLGATWRKMKAGENSAGYPSVCLSAGPRRRTLCVHQLVMIAFVGPAPAGMEVAHENGNPSDCRLANLSYKTPAGNQGDRVRHGTHSRGEKNGFATLTEDAVRAIRRDHVPGRRDNAALARKYGISRTTIREVLLGRRWRHVQQEAV